MKKTLSEFLDEDTPHSVALDLAIVVGGFLVRGCLYVAAVAALCLASVVRVGEFWTSPTTGAVILVAFAVLAFVAARALHRLSQSSKTKPHFCEPRRWRVPLGSIPAPDGKPIPAEASRAGY